MEGELKKKINMGILGCAEIARKVSRSMTLAPNANLYAIGSRSIEKARKFSKENNFPDSTKIHGSYEAVLDDPGVDAVYIPLPTSLHVKWACLAAQKKKHLLLEKPVALNIREFDVIVEACKANGVQIMDCTMWVHHPRTALMKDFLKDPERFGQLKSVQSVVTFVAKPDFLENDIRVKPDLDALGALGDIGWYCTRSILWANDFELPQTATALPGTVYNKAGVILSCGAYLHWEDGRIATFLCSFLLNLTMDVLIIGSKGTLRFNDLVIPFEEDKVSYTAGTNCDFNELSTGWGVKPSEHIVTTDIPQDALMVKEFCNLVGRIKYDGAEPDSTWPILSRKTQAVLDAVKASIDSGGKPVDIVY